MKIATYKDAVNYLESFIGKIRFEITSEFIKHHDPLERMRVLLSLLGNPQNKFQSVLVGGTAGKGSTAYLISYILTTAGYKTGLTISPHLQKINERIQINGKSISDKEFAKMLGSIVDTIELMRRKEVGAPSYFEILIAMAFLYFAQQKVDIAVVEVGMGGEFDATNTLYPLVAVLTNVSLDHTNVLGGTVQKIARTKVGIIKGSASPLRSPRQFGDSSNPNVSQRFSLARAKFSKIGSKDSLFKSSPHAEASRGESNQNLIVVTGAKQKSVIKIVEDRCKEVGAKLYRLYKDFDSKIKKESLEGSVFDLTIACDRIQQLNDLNLSLLGGHQVENASLAIQTVRQLADFGFKITDGTIRKALKTAFFPGRFEVINYTLVLDGAHNPTKMKAFLSTLEKLYPKNPKIFVVAFKSDKNIKGMLRQILKVAEKIIVTEFHVATDMNKNASAEALNIKYQISRLRQDFGGQANIKYGGRVVVEKDSKKALKIALNYPISQLPNYQSIVVVTGSLYLVGEIRNFLL